MCRCASIGDEATLEWLLDVPASADRAYERVYRPRDFFRSGSSTLVADYIMAANSTSRV